MGPERFFRTQVVAPFLKTLDCTEAFPIQQISIVGDPDYILCAHGTFVALELKREKGKARKLQQYKLDRVTETHGVAIVASPANWDQVKEVLILLNQGEYK